MPKQPAGISKFQRIEALREVLRRWGKLNKQEVDSRVAAHLGCESEQISRALYRDLQELEDLGQLSAFHFSRDGQFIADYDPDVHKNTFCEWSLPETENAIRGVKRLLENQMGIRCSARLNRSIAIGDGKPLSKGDRLIGIYFQAGGKSHSISIDAEALPFQIYIGRGVADQNQFALTEEIEKELGKRVILLSVPFLGVSSFKNTPKSGHLVLSFPAVGKIEVSDLNSKNGTYVVELGSDEAESLIRKNNSSLQAATTYVHGSGKDPASKKQVSSSLNLVTSFPIQIYASLEFVLIVSMGA